MADIHWEDIGQHSNSWPALLVPQICWSTFHKVHRYLPMHIRAFLTEVHERGLPTNMVLREMGYQSSGACPYCPEDEDMEHLFKCRNHPRNWQRMFLEGLEDRFTETEVDPITEDNFIAGITSWLTDGPTSPADPQLSIGWFHAFTGKLHIEWRLWIPPWKWTRAIARYFIYSFYELWRERCGVVRYQRNLQIRYLSSRQEIISISQADSQDDSSTGSLSTTEYCLYRGRQPR
jgi:zinc-binding in reverse transcriptase